MTDYLLIIVGTVWVNNLVLSQFLGLCPFMGVSRKFETAIGMGLATTFVLTLSAIFSYATHAFILQPLQLEYLNTLSFILTLIFDNSKVPLRGTFEFLLGFNSARSTVGYGNQRGTVPNIGNTSGCSGFAP